MQISGAFTGFLTAGGLQKGPAGYGQYGYGQYGQYGYRQYSAGESVSLKLTWAVQKISSNSYFPFHYPLVDNFIEWIQIFIQA